MANDKAEMIIDAVTEKYDVSRQDMLEALRGGDDGEGVSSPPKIEKPEVESSGSVKTPPRNKPSQQSRQRTPQRVKRPAQGTKDPLANQRGISDVGVQEKQPTVTRGSVVGSGSIIGDNPIIGAMGMKEIGDRIFGRRRRR